MSTARLLALAGGALALAAMSAGCARQGVKGFSFGDDAQFLKQHTDAIVLSDAAGKAQVVVVPAYQGRVMTSTAGGEEGRSFGWINRELIAQGQLQPHINAFGGEDRFWLGPEGGQFALYFKPGDPFDFEHWQTPAVIDTEAYELKVNAGDRAHFTKRASLTNYSGTKFDFSIDRKIRLIGPSEAGLVLNCPIPNTVQLVGFESENTIANRGKTAWTMDKGLLSIWILGMFNPAPGVTIVIPFKTGPEGELGPIVNDAYFGKVPADRLIVKDRTPPDDGVLFFKGDGQYRGKIGLSPLRAKPIAGSYDEDAGVLTIVTYTKPEMATHYVNSMWEIQKQPYAGDVLNSYNDGPTPGGKPLGPFYELESSSPAVALNPNQSLTHIHRTFHIQGCEKDLDAIARRTLGVNLEEIRQAF